jgi:hypothetical protein
MLISGKPEISAESAGGLRFANPPCALMARIDRVTTRR